MSLNGRPVKGVLLDITGVLAESSSEGDGVAIQGSVQAVQKLRDNAIPFRFVTNETQRTRKSLVDKLRRLGFTLEESEVFTPALAMSCILLEKNLSPHLLVHPQCVEDLLGKDGVEAKSPDCVVIGDAMHEFTYDNMNKCFKLLMSSSEVQLYSLGKGKYYQEDGSLTLDLGPFTVALEFATGKTATVCGKPSADFFGAAFRDMALTPESVVMVGDDINSDVGGAQAAGMMGVLVRTGKFRPENEAHPTVKPDLIVDRLECFVDLVAGNK